MSPERSLEEIAPRLVERLRRGRKEMDEFLQQLQDGQFDGQLERLEHALTARRAVLAATEADQFQPGDRVMFNGKTSPKRHVGEEATVIGPAPRRGGAPKLLVKVDGQERPMKVPPVILTKIPS